MPTDLILPVSITFALVAWTLVFYWYIHPVARKYPFENVVEPLLLLHAFRYIGLMFLIPGITSAPLDIRFAHPAAYGDLVAAVLAYAAIIAIRLDSNWVQGLVWIFNIWGLADLINAVARGVLFTPDGDLGATYWIPALIVPLLAVSHVYIFYLLVKEIKIPIGLVKSLKKVQTEC